MKKQLMIMLLCALFWVEADAQVSLNPEKSPVELYSDYSKFDDIESYDRTDHVITIDFQAKKILVAEAASGREVYSIDYQVHEDGTSNSVILQPGENLFIVRADSIELCSYQDMFKAFSINFMNERTHSFMGIER